MHRGEKTQLPHKAREEGGMEREKKDSASLHSLSDPCSLKRQKQTRLSTHKHYTL